MGGGGGLFGCAVGMQLEVIIIIDTCCLEVYDCFTVRDFSLEERKQK